MESINDPLPPLAEPQNSHRIPESAEADFARILENATPLWLRKLRAPRPDLDPVQLDGGSAGVGRHGAVPAEGEQDPAVQLAQLWAKRCRRGAAGR